MGLQQRTLPSVLSLGVCVDVGAGLRPFLGLHFEALQGFLKFSSCSNWYFGRICRSFAIVGIWKREK